MFPIHRQQTISTGKGPAFKKNANKSNIGKQEIVLYVKLFTSYLFKNFMLALFLTPVNHLLAIIILFITQTHFKIHSKGKN